MGKDSGERKSGDQFKKGKEILMYQRKRSKKDGHNKKAVTLSSKQQALPPPERDCPAGFLPPSNENHKTRREISMPKLEDISFIELLASDDERAPSQPAISFMDMLQNENLKGDHHQALVPAGEKVAVGSNLRQRFVEESKVQNGLGEPKPKLNYFMKMVMEEEGGVDDEQLFREVKQELMIREVDAYACLLRKQNLDFGKLMRTN